MAFSIKTRQDNIEKLKKEEMDLLIIGGGITGAGVAIQAAASGIKTGLIEMQDYAEGTSSRSTKLVHGGIRYLKNFDVEVVAETVAERAIVQNIAPHIPKPDPMIMPIYEDEGVTTFNMFSMKVAMDLYDQLANVKGTKYENYTLTAQETIERAPFLKKKGLLGAGVYLDFSNNDSRLVIENIKQAASDGAYLANKVKAIGFIYDKSQIVGVKAEDLLTGQVFDIHAKLVINTAGPWVDSIRNLNHNRQVIPQLRPTKGVHLVIDASKLNISQPIYFDTGMQDGRMVFAIPREGKTYFGTTDTDYQGDLAHPTVTLEDVDYLLSVINHRFPDTQLTINDIESSWVGLRPLIASSSGSDYNGGGNKKVPDAIFNDIIAVVAKYQQQEVTREEVEDKIKSYESKLVAKEEHPSAVSRGSLLEQEEDGLITLSGGKITDYRKMAEGAIKMILPLLKNQFDLTFKEIDSATYPVSGGHFDVALIEDVVLENTKIGISKGLSKETAEYIAEFYGTNAKTIFDLIGKTPVYDGLSVADSICLTYSLDNEMVLTPADYLVRRTNHMLFIRDTLNEMKEPIVNAMATYFNWTSVEIEKHLQELNQVIDESDLKELKKGSN